MSKYFFHIDDGTPPIEHEALEADSLADAKCQAVKLAGQMICDAADGFWDRQEWKLTAADEKGLTLFSLEFVGTEAPAVTAMRPASVTPAYSLSASA
jgi:hypothetical protein